jgi:hypothetical protein
MSRFTEADRLLRLLVLERRSCERCGAVSDPSRMDTAHILRRGYSATRCDEENVWLLCHEPCHRLVDSDVRHHAQLVGRTIGLDRFRALSAQAHAGPSEPLSMFWKSETARLRKRCSAEGIPTRRAS